MFGEMEAFIVDGRKANAGEAPLFADKSDKLVNTKPDTFERRFEASGSREGSADWLQDCVYLRENIEPLMQTLELLAPRHVIWANEIRGVEEVGR